MIPTGIDNPPTRPLKAFAFDPSRGKRGKLVLQSYNTVVPLLEEGAPITAEPDARTPAP